MTFTRLKHLCQDAGQYGYNWPASDYVSEDVGLRLLRTTDLQPGGLLPASNGIFVPLPVPAEFLLEPNDILLTRSGTVGRSYLVPEEAAGSTFAGFLVRFRPRPDVDPRYVAYALLSAPVQAQIQAEAITSTIQNFNAERYANLEVWAPEVNEQRRIADFLDDQVVVLDRAIRAHEARRALVLERFRTRLAAETLLRKGSPGNDRTRVKYLFEYERNGIWGSDAEGGPDDISCVRVADFDREQFTASDAPTIRSVPKAQRLPRLLRRGDVLLEKSGGTQDKPVGCAVNYVSDAPAVCSNFIAALRPAAHVLPRFAGLLMSALYQTRRNGPFVNQTTGIQNLDSAAYLAQEVWVPGLGDQEAIVRSVEGESERAQQLMRLAEMRVRLLQERKQALITAAVTGQFDVTTARAVA